MCSHRFRRYDTLDDEAEGIAACVRELETTGVLLREQAILCRTNTRLNEIASALEARGIPVLHLGSLFERDEVRDLLALLSLAVDPFGDGIVRIGAMGRYNLSLQDVFAATTGSVHRAIARSRHSVVLLTSPQSQMAEGRDLPSSIPIFRI